MSIASKRFLSYILDMFLIFIILFLLKSVMPVNKYEIELSDLNESYLEQKVDVNEYMSKLKVITHNIDKENIEINIAGTLLIIVSFVIVPNISNGQTLGQKLLKIKISKDKPLRMDDLVGRAVIINGLGYMIFMFIILYLTSDSVYFILINLLGFFQILMVIINGFMVLYSKEKRGIADRFTDTRIEEIK